jgi:SHS2 domain-containing protein
LMGMQSTSGQSGIQVAQLQTAARTYLREDIESYRRFLQNITTWLMKQIIRYRNYPHTIPGLQENNQRGMVEVATDISNRLDTDEFYIQITLQDNAEVVKQIEREFYQYLVQNGMITPLSFMRKTDVQNPEKEIQDMQEWQGERQMIEMLRTIPGAAETLTQYAQQYQQQLASTQPQSGKPNGPQAR